jgi:signal transduction histidine kinase
LMDEVLLLARVEAGRMECKPSPLDLRELCRQVAADVRSSTADACPINVNARNVMVGAAADESLLRHIFTNLLNNAVKYSEAGTPVDFSVDRAGQEAVFVVRDKGVGIPEADQSRLFLTFHRGANVGERPGTGLGLVIVKRCVILHGGTVDLESKEGKGTVVTVRLPLFAGRKAGAPSKRTAVRTGKQPKRKNPAVRSSKRPPKS